MRSVPDRGPGLTLLALVSAFVVGSFAGAWLGEFLAPDSRAAQMVSIAAFPLAFLAGHVFWFGLGVVTAVISLVIRLVTGRLRFGATPGQAVVPTGYGAFVLVSVLFTCVAGCVVAAASDTTGIGVAVAAYALVGGVYGGALWWLAHHGYLPFPEPH